jgi:hypothetical protein
VAEEMPGLCQGLHATGSVGTLAAQRLVDLAWEWLGQDIGAGLTSSPGRRDEKLAGLGQPLASVLTAAAVIGAAGTRDMVAGYVREQADAVTALRCPRCAPRRSGPGTARAVRPASVTWSPTARHGSAPGLPGRGVRPATGRSNCRQAAAPARCAIPSARS